HASNYKVQKFSLGLGIRMAIVGIIQQLQRVAFERVPTRIERAGEIVVNEDAHGHRPHEREQRGVGWKEFWSENGGENREATEGVEKFTCDRPALRIALDFGCHHVG